MTKSNQELPPEMQARIAQIVAGAKSDVDRAFEQPSQASKPTLMDMMIMLRQEVNRLSQELNESRQQQEAIAQVVDATGQAVGQMYAAMFEKQQKTASQKFQEDDY